MENIISFVLITLGVAIILSVVLFSFIGRKMDERIARWKECKKNYGHEFYVAGDVCDRCGIPRKFL